MKSGRAKLAFITVTVGLSMGAASVGAQGGTFTSTAEPMTTPRALHRATLLQDGRVLLTGGVAESPPPGNVPTAETFDPLTGTFSPTVGSPIVARAFHRSTLLVDGRVLITGGDSRGGGGTIFSSAELFDPTYGTFSPTGPMTTGRSGHTATRLQDGKVLITGGGGSGGTILSSAELFDPMTGIFSSTTGLMTETRLRHSATLLADGTVLVAGGIGATGFLSTAEIFDPTTQMFTATVGSMTRQRGTDHTATRLQDSTVLLVGGFGSPLEGKPSGDIYDPITKTFRETAHSMVGPRDFHSATLLGDGTVLIAGGRIGGGGTTFTAAIYEPSTERFTGTAPGHMTIEREFHTATLLLVDGTVLITGGFGRGTGGFSSNPSSAEIFAP